MNAEPNELRPRMLSVTYRVLGSVTDAKDAVHDAYLSLQTAENVTSPEGFLVKSTTRRCIDQLHANRHRQKYIGPWLDGEDRLSMDHVIHQENHHEDSRYRRHRTYRLQAGNNPSPTRS